MSAAVEIARHEWAEGYRRLEREHEDRRRYGALHAQVEAIMAELRRRIGSDFTVAELAAEHRGADSWAREAVAELPADAQWPAGVSIATDAAFHLYVRGARDYEP
ncbi:MAG TPA: hypothetical protein VJT84_05830 [Gaiellaceae bacterium]|nr:hypothetical protein [Gaiellaceae bacterium]